MFERASRWVTAPPNAGTRWTIGVLALLLLAYTTVRAAIVSFSYDEAYTFMNHVRKGVFFQDTFDLMGANHHLLNVWLMWGSGKLFGWGEFALRLPNLLAHVLYLYASARLALKASSAALGVGAFLLLNMHPYLLDFFSLARGYGLSCGFMMMALWYAWLSLQEDGKRSQALCGICFAALGTLAHSILVNFLLGMAGAFVVLWLFEMRQVGIRARIGSVGWAMLIVFSCLVLVLPNSLSLRQGGALYFGSDGLWGGMVDSLAVKFLYHYPYVWEARTIVGWLLVALSTWVVVALVVSIRRKEGAIPLRFGLLLLFVILLSFWTQNAWLDLPWPRSRTALFLLPLLAFILVVSLISWRTARVIPIIVAVLFCIPLVSHMFRSWNLTHVVEWKPSGEMRQMLEVIAEDHLPLCRERPLVTLSTGPECSAPLDYYAFTRGWPWLDNAPRTAPERFASSDYYVVEFDGQNEVDRTNWTLLYHSEETNTSLYRDERLRMAQATVIHHAMLDMEAAGLSGAWRDDHMSGSQCVRFDGDVRSTDKLRWIVPEGWDGSGILATGSLLSREQDDRNWLSMVIQVVRNGNVIELRDLPSHRQILRYGEWGRVSVVLRSRTALLPGDEVQFHISPQSASPSILVDDMELSILR